MSRKRKTFSAEFKAKLVLELLEGEKTLNEIASENGVLPNILPQFLPKHIPPQKSRQYLKFFNSFSIMLLFEILYHYY